MGPAALKTFMQQKSSNCMGAAEKFVACLKSLAENDRIASLSITISGQSSDELFQLAQAIGIKDVTVTAKSGL